MSDHVRDKPGNVMTVSWRDESCGLGSVRICGHLASSKCHMNVAVVAVLCSGLAFCEPTNGV